MYAERYRTKKLPMSIFFLSYFQLKATSKYFSFMHCIELMYILLITCDNIQTKNESPAKWKEVVLFRIFLQHNVIYKEFSYQS